MHSTYSTDSGVDVKPSGRETAPHMESDPSRIDSPKPYVETTRERREREEREQREREPKTYGSAVVERSILSAAMDRVIRVVQKKQTIPILSYVRLRGFGEHLEITGTDLDIEIKARIPAAADPSLDICVPGHALLRLLKNAKACDHVAIDWPGHSVGLDFAGLRVALDAPLPSENFPTMPFEREGMPTFMFPLEGSVISDMVRKVGICISTEETRYYLNGIFFEPCRYPSGRPAPEYRFTATDGHRLCTYKIPMPDGAEKSPPFIFPRPYCMELERLVAGRRGADSVLVTVSGTETANIVVRAESGWFTYTGKTIDGSFPDYRRVIRDSEGDESRITMDRATLLGTIKEVAIVSDRKDIAAKYEFGRSKVTVTCKNVDVGRAMKDMDILRQSGEDFAIGFNSKYLMEMLDSVDGDTVTFGFDGAGAPATMSDSASNVLFVLMPMRVS